ncbi:Ribosomal protein S6 kinase-like protein [Ooceraea biroi]|nr:Ribosomal protein S6 kinase-like protein [Ooceraea biroi]
MAPSKDKWIRRFIITETKRHKKGFTIYKVTSMIFLKASHEEVSKVSVWKRYNDFKKLHSELGVLHKRLGIKESFPTLPKSKYFGRFEAEVVEERKKYALKFLEFVGRYSYLYSSDIFITFFESSHVECSSNRTHSSSPTRSDTSEEDRIAAKNDPLIVNDNTARDTFQTALCLPKTPSDVSTNLCSTVPNTDTNENEFTESRTNESHGTINLQSVTATKDEQSNKTTKLYVQNTVAEDCNVQNVKNTNLNRNNATALNNELGFDSLNNNISKSLSNHNTEHSTYSAISQEAVELSQTQPDPTQYLLIAAGHMSAAFKHESIAEYEEAFMQYKLGISCLINGVQYDPNGARVVSIKDKISKYLTQAEQLYNRYLNCNVSVVNKPVSELQYYKVLKAMKSVMLVMDVRANCDRIIKPVEKSSSHENNISDYVLRGQVPYMVHLYACVETETTVFLILQYASCGKLWDFVRLHYGTSDSLPYTTNVISNRAYTKELNNDEVNEDAIKLRKINNIIQNNKLQGKIHSTSVQSEIYSTEVPTIQLLEKSQKLLQSVSATLKRSNSIASRLNESADSRQSGNAASLSNARAVTQISQEPHLTLSSSVDDITVNGNFSTKSFVRKIILKDASPLFSANNSENRDRTGNHCAPALKENCAAHDSLGKNQTSDLRAIDNSASRITSMHNVSNDTIRISEKHDTKNISDRFSNINCIDEAQYPCKENDVEEEQELWQIPEGIIRTWVAEILLALEALHRQDVLVLDLNPDNILLDEAGHVRLTYIVPQRDVELSKLTHPYSSPESVRFSPTVAVTTATDIWSVGVILYELLTGATFVAKHPGLFHSHSALNIPSNLSASGKSLLC